MLGSLLPGGALTADVALLVAALRGRRWHRQDLFAGGDLARLARSRRAPAAFLRQLPRKSIGAGRGARRSDRGRLLLGYDSDSRAVHIASGPGRSGHTLVLGATGSGKTVTQTLLAVDAIERGSAAIVVDPKGDRGMRAQLRAAARRAGREFLEWTPHGPTVYNPYGRGRETEIADRVLAGERFTEPHYQRQAQRYMGHVARVLRAGGTEVSLRAIVRLLEPDQLELALRELPEEPAGEGHAYLDSLTSRQQRDLAGVRDRLAILTESDIGRWLDPAHDGDGRFDLMRVARSGAVAYLNLESDSRPLLAQMLGAAIVQDLQSAVASLQDAPSPTIVVLDEFSALAAERVVGLFARSRSAGFSLLLGTQELSDLRIRGNERLLEQVLGNLSMVIAHRQVVPASAEMLARLGGTRGAWRVTWGSDGRTTRTRVDEPAVTPAELARLAPGWALVVSLARPQAPRIAHVIPTVEGA
jgi:type IV secretory pathway TraG/TraD family ATPase VirD4